jgi:hypothetical protein
VKNLVRMLTVWILLLAVPFQGAAAAAMLPRAAAPAHAMHQMAEAGLPPCHRGAATGNSEGTHQQHQTPHGGAASCASCAACGIFSAMLPASFPALASHAPPGATCDAAEQRLPSVHLAQPERPPRPLLA